MLDHAVGVLRYISCKYGQRGGVSAISKRGRHNSFLDDEAEMDTFDSGDEDEDQIAQTDIEFVNDEEDPDESPCFYRAIERKTLIQILNQWIYINT